MVIFLGQVFELGPSQTVNFFLIFIMLTCWHNSVGILEFGFCQPKSILGGGCWGKLGAWFLFKMKGTCESGSND